MPPALNGYPAKSVEFASDPACIREIPRSLPDSHIYSQGKAGEKE